ncbi:MAG: amidinotransferase [bacterium]|nr:amidinotransferase [bacterium]
MKEFGAQSMVAPLRRVLVRRPDSAFAVDDPSRWHYLDRPNLRVAQQEHDVLVQVLRDNGAEVLRHDLSMPDHADAIYVHDPVLVCDRGAILLAMGKKLRQGEEEAIGDALASFGVPIFARITGEGRAEGGDLVWLDEETLLAGVGFRTNREGVAQLQAALAPDNVDVIGVDLPYFQGPDACLHLMSVLSMVDEDLAVVYSPLTPVSAWKVLEQRGCSLVEVPEEEFESMGPNVLALSPRNCLMLEGNPITQARLEENGCTVTNYSGNELSLKAEGGPTCLTRPVLRG